MKKHEAEGRCFENALRGITFPYEFKGWTLVHGIPTLQAGKYKGRKYAHAWLENGDEVYDIEAKRKVNKKLYYKIGKIKFTRKYNASEASRLAIEHGHYGPWNDKILNTDPYKEETRNEYEKFIRRCQRAVDRLNRGDA